MTGDDVLKLAGELFARSRSPSEALCRAIIGRAYYGAYHLALAFFVDLGLPESNHADTWRRLIACGEANAKKAGRLLESLYAARRRADYKLNDSRAVQEARDLQFVKSQIELATDIKSLLVQCASEPARSLIKAGIQTFLHQ